MTTYIINGQIREISIVNICGVPKAKLRIRRNDGLDVFCVADITQDMNLFVKDNYIKITGSYTWITRTVAHKKIRQYILVCTSARPSCGGAAACTKIA